MSESNDPVDESWRDAAQIRLPKLTNRQVAEALMRDPDGYAYVVGDELSIHPVADAGGALAHVTHIKSLASGGMVIHSCDDGCS